MLPTLSIFQLPLKNTYRYANDLVLLMFFSLSESISAILTINQDVQSIADWAASNALHLNPTKSSLIIMSFPSLTSRLQSFDVCLNSTFFLRSSSIKILGVHLDSSWSFLSHVSAKEVVKLLSCLYPSKAPFVTFSQLIENSS